MFSFLRKAQKEKHDVDKHLLYLVLVLRRKKNITGPPQVRRVSVCPEDKEIGGMYRAVEETEQFKEGRGERPAGQADRSC